MKQILLDTSFILSCIRNKIDFFEDLKLQGYEILIPKQVIVELGGLSNSKQESNIALKLLEKNKFKKVDLETKDVDKGLIDYANKNKIIVGTLDREIKNKVRYGKIVIRGKKRLGVV
ncbi:MAG: PIN domain-containing protein [archaeon]